MKNHISSWEFDRSFRSQYRLAFMYRKLINKAFLVERKECTAHYVNKIKIVLPHEKFWFKI